MAVKPIIESIRDYILTCDFLKDWKVNVDYLGVECEYSIDPFPAESIIKKYTDGGTIRQFQFTFTSKEEFDGDVITSIENSGFYEKFSNWIEENSLLGILPILQDSKCKSQQIETLNSGFLFSTDVKHARYQIQCRLIYYKEA